MIFSVHALIFPEKKKKTGVPILHGLTFSALSQDISFFLKPNFLLNDIILSRMI